MTQIIALNSLLFYRGFKSSCNLIETIDLKAFYSGTCEWAGRKKHFLKVIEKNDSLKMHVLQKCPPQKKKESNLLTDSEVMASN